MSMMTINRSPWSIKGLLSFSDFICAIFPRQKWLKASLSANLCYSAKYLIQHFMWLQYILLAPAGALSMMMFNYISGSNPLFEIFTWPNTSVSILSTSWSLREQSLHWRRAPTVLNTLFEYHWKPMVRLIAPIRLKRRDTNAVAYGATMEKRRLA